MVVEPPRHILTFFSNSIAGYTATLDGGTMRNDSMTLAMSLMALGLVATPAFADDAAKAPAPAAPAAKPSGEKATEGAGQKAQEKLSQEDPTKEVEKADPANMKESPDPAVSKQANGMWVDKDGNPTPHFSKDGKPDWFTFSGYRRYGANCLVCHGPDGMGSSYAPNLVDVLKTLQYPQFMQTVAAGKKDVNNSSNLVMPAFGDNKNVQCYINDIYTYLRARSLGLLDRTQPSAHEEKPGIYTTAETACLGF
jgi:methanol metabolism-related c-type cytochrome